MTMISIMLPQSSPSFNGAVGIVTCLQFNCASKNYKYVIFTKWQFYSQKGLQVCPKWVSITLHLTTT